MSNASPLFSVVLCTYQRYDLLERAMESVRNQDLDASLFDLWVVDNSPSSDTRTAWAKKYENSPNLHYVTLDVPGLSNARNEAVQRSSGEFLVFLDDDAVAKTSWLTSYRDAFTKAGDKVGAIGGKIVPHFEIPRPSWLDDRLMVFLSLVDWFPSAQELPISITPTGANMAVRRTALLETGLFNTSLGRQGIEANNLLSGEEEQLFSLMREKGWRLFYEPLAEVTHFVPAARLTQAWFRRRFMWQGVSDQIRNVLRPEDDLPLWSHVVDYVRRVPLEQAPFMGLCWDTEDPVLFCKQLDCIQFMTRLMAARGDYPPEMKVRMGPSKP